MAVENFIQGSIFEDIFPSVPANSHFQRIDTPQTTAVLASPLAPASTPPTPLPEFRVIRSARRKRGASASRSNGLIEIYIPDRTSRKAERELIPEMITLLLAREAKSRRTEPELERMGLALLARYLPEFHERPASITWRSMQGRWGSCTTIDGTIRIASRLASAPSYVLDCVIFHELIHLRIPGHGAEFGTLLSRYPDLERAESYLEGFEAGLAAPPDTAEQITPQELP